MIKQNPHIFIKHPDCDQLCLAIFLLSEYLKGPEKSFWWPYIDVMNESDIASFWSESELERLGDYELKREAQTYKDEVLFEWDQISKLIPLYPEAFPGGACKEQFLLMYNYACTRCFGWTLPSTMMVPLADFLNHQPCDTQYEIYQRDLHTVKTSVDSQGYRTPKRFSIDYTQIYTDSELAGLNEETLGHIKGEVEEKDRIYIPRKQLFNETKDKLENKPLNNVWEVGYWSTDDEEDNDSDYEGPEVSDEEGEDEEEDEYDEEDSQERADPTDKIKQEKYESTLKPEEKKYLLQVSEIEKKIMQQNHFFDKRKKVASTEADFKWWKFDDAKTYFVLTTKRRSTYRRGEQIFNCYGRRSNKFLLIL